MLMKKSSISKNRPWILGSAQSNKAYTEVGLKKMCPFGNMDELWENDAEWNKADTERMIPLFEASIVKFTETGTRMVVSRGWEEGRRERCSVGTEFQFHEMEKFWRSVVQQCVYTWHYSTVHVKMVKMEIFLVVQWLRIALQCLGCGFHPWVRS